MKPKRWLLAPILTIRQLYVPLGIRIRQWGTLPPDRGPTILITNHQHVDEGEIVFSRTYLLHKHKQIVAVNSRRTFETGFFAARLPWTAPFTRNINPTNMWLALSLLPIENHLHSRALISLAEEMRHAHGDVPLSTLLPDDVLADLGLSGINVSDLWKPEYFMKAQTPVKLARLHQPYRREALENFRTNVAADIATVKERVLEGATFYVTPEGDFSHDGRLRPMRNGITDAIVPIADPWLCAIAYDPFRGKRLSMLYRIVKPANVDELGPSLAAARAVTTTVLLAKFLAEHEGTFTCNEALASVQAQLAALPDTVFVDPELVRATHSATTEAIANLIERGTLARVGAAFRLTDKRTDPRFPHIADMIAYHRNMIDETIESALTLA